MSGVGVDGPLRLATLAGSAVGIGLIELAGVGSDVA